MNLEKFSEGAQKLRVLGIKVTQNGVPAAEQLWDEECRRNIYSASKSFTSCAAGFAVKEGLFSQPALRRGAVNRGGSANLLAENHGKILHGIKAHLGGDFLYGQAGREQERFRVAKAGVFDILGEGLAPHLLKETGDVGLIIIEHLRQVGYAQIVR